MPWKKIYETGIPLVDKHHKKLIEYIDDLKEALEKGKDLKSRILLDALLSYADYHFSTEERLLKEALEECLKKGEDISSKEEYQRAHCKAHEFFRKKVREFHTKYKAGEEINFLEVLSFLEDWLINHIGKTDKKLCPFYDLLANSKKLYYQQG